MTEAQRLIPIDEHDLPRFNCRRHVRSCPHFAPFVAKEGEKVSRVREVTAEEMLTIPACQTCGEVDERPTLVETCPRCQIAFAANGECGC